MSKNSKDENKFDEEKVLGKLKEKLDICNQYYARDVKRMRMLDMVDSGDIWKAIDAKFPPYQILPDTNKVNYVKENILASLYTTCKSASILPTSEDDAELCTKLNLILDNLWEVEDIAFKQFEAGERAALLNIGISQIGWEENTMRGKNKGAVVVKNVDPMQFRRDPFAQDLESSGYCYTFERLHKSIILENPKYKDIFKKWLDERQYKHAEEMIPAYNTKLTEGSHSDDHFNLYRWWVRTPEGINEIHTIDTDVILYHKENIKPSVFPFAILYCNAPGNKLIGASGPAKIFANSVAYNFIMSLMITLEYKNQRPPKFLNTQSGLNVAAFTRHGAEADRTFVVNGDASQAVHYQQFPAMSPNVTNMLEMIGFDVNAVSGVDDKYTGRDTGSIITTGGTEEMLNRVTMIDTPKIMNYEKYTKDLTKIVLQYMLEYSPKRTYFIKDDTSSDYNVVEVDFPKIDKNAIFNYAIAISSELPKNKQRIAAWADMIMEKQMQYRENGGDVNLLTEEEWLQMQDVPFKEQLLERMGFQRDTNTLKEVSQTVLQFNSLLEQGLSPDEAMMQVAETLNATRKGQPIEEVADQAPIQPDPSMMMPSAPMGTGQPVGLM